MRGTKGSAGQWCRLNVRIPPHVCCKNIRGTRRELFKLAQLEVLQSRGFASAASSAVCFPAVHSCLPRGAPKFHRQGKDLSELQTLPAICVDLAMAVCSAFMCVEPRHIYLRVCLPVYTPVKSSEDT